MKYLIVIYFSNTLLFFLKFYLINKILIIAQILKTNKNIKAMMAQHQFCVTVVIDIHRLIDEFTEKIILVTVILTSLQRFK